MGRVISTALKEQIPSEYCYYCGRKLNSTNRTYDHVVPVKKGGKDEVENLVACCSDCNHYKKDYTLYELLNALDCQKKFCDDEVRMAELEYRHKIFALAKARRKT